MDFLKELLQIQHELILNQVSDKICKDPFEKELFILKYNKSNYYLLKVCNCKMKQLECVKINNLLSTL